MAVLQYLGQVPAQWFDASGNAALSGGKLQFFEVGTTTPKAVYSDYQGNTSAGTTVTLDSSGRANIWLSGLYSVQLLTAADVPIGNRIDGIGEELAPDVDASAVLSVETYDDLRALIGANVRICGVEGRAANGDGGAGMFAWDDAETAVDDGGTILTPDTLPASGRWVRIFSGDMDFRWFGDITGTDDTTAYALGLAASVARGRWLSIHSGTVRLTSSVSASAGAMVRIPLGGKIVAASSLVGLGFPAGTRFDGSPGCFGENISVSFGLNAVPAVDVTWWDVATDDTRLIEACDACSAANMEVLIPRVMSLEAGFTQPANAVLRFQGPGKLQWGSGGGAVSVALRRWTGDANDAPRFTWPTVAKLSALTMVESQGVYLSPKLFGGSGTGVADESAAVWPAILHGWIWCDAKYLCSTSLAKTGSVYIRGPLTNARDITDAAFVPHGIYLASGISLSTTEDLSIDGTCIEATNAAQSVVDVGLRFTLHNGALFGQSNAGVASLGVQCYGADIADAQTKNCPVHTSANGYLRDSDIYGTATFDVSAVPQIGLGGSAWEIARSYIEKTGSLGAFLITDSTMDSVGSIAYSAGAIVTASTVTPTDTTTSAGTTVGDLQIIGGNVTLPIIGTDGHNIALSGFPEGVTVPWNGYGDVSINGTRTVHNASSTDYAVRRAAKYLDGIESPITRSSSMGATEVPTAATTNWVFGASGTPTIGVDEFTWAGTLAASPATIDKTITTNAEKILAAYGGCVVLEFSGDVSAATLLFGAESITVTKSPGVSSIWQKAVIPVWPGVVAATTSYSVRLTHGGGTVSLRVTIHPCAPIHRGQWESYWGGDRTLSASRFNSWKDTFDQGGTCAALDTWADDIGTYNLYTPRPETTQPWLTTLAAPVKIWPMDQTLPSVGIVGHTLFGFKATSGTGFRIFNCGGS